MNQKYPLVKETLEKEPKVWLVTGCAGFIGSNLIEALLDLGQSVVGLDNFSTGFQANLDEVKQSLPKRKWDNFTFFEGDICDLDLCMKAVSGVDYVLHQAALGSVPRSIDDPINSNMSNVTGFLNMLVAAKNEGIKKFVYAASSSTYGDHPDLPKLEQNIGNPLSPYAVTKYVNELYANVFFKVYGTESVGLRYFNVFGKRQNPNGAYAAVIPKWIGAILNDEEIKINGDGTTSRDFCYVENAIQANILAAVDKSSSSEVYNVACNNSTSLNSLKDSIYNEIRRLKNEETEQKVSYSDFRRGDVKHSLANIDKAMSGLGYVPEFQIDEGLLKTIPWYIN